MMKGDNFIKCILDLSNACTNLERNVKIYEFMKGQYNFTYFYEYEQC